ncbi:hypothetical protein Sango_2720000 [Sesamum angolense]|uniref:Retrovirus-related Pol polyprotein from transposon TNT 1-94-like beta-barrel domain-containing protein n=1 Tax=Sesamum angolense TaxID=2727404 RepID=A0AAE1W385_9LAMI|nr:hypothetical protein Sango_2720000 [Sesamum angolense]
MSLLTFLKVAYVLDLNQLAPTTKENESDDDKVSRLKKEEDELLCHGHILNTLSNGMFDLYASLNSPLRYGLLWRTNVILMNMAAAVQSNDWCEIGATIHVCNDKNHFKDYEITPEGQNAAYGKCKHETVLEKGSVEMHFTSEKKLMFTNVLHFPKICKNLDSTTLLCKKSLKAATESDKLIFTKTSMFVFQVLSFTDFLQPHYRNRWFAAGGHNGLSAM